MQPVLPIPRLRRSNHVVAALFVSIAFSAAGWSLAKHFRTQVAGDQQNLKNAQGELLKANQQPAPPANFMHSLPPATKADDVVSDAGRSAQAHGVQLSSLSIQKQPASPRELGQVRFAISAQSGYQAFKIWLADMQGRYPTMGVQTLSMRSLQNDSRQEIQLALVLFVKD